MGKRAGPLILFALPTTLHHRTMSDARDPRPRLSVGAVAPAAAPESEAMALAREAAAGSSVATGRLLRLLAPRLGSIVRAIMGATHPDRDDALQLVLIAFVQALPAFRGECDPAGYASTIAVRTALAARKRARTRDAREESTVVVETGDSASPGELADAHRRKELLRQLLGALPPEQGEALAMRVVLGWSLEEIATHMRAPVNTVRSRLRLAREAMKRRIEADAALLEALEVEP
jgi:RNA polymerase sigma-70 factor (ECF subfamily)